MQLCPLHHHPFVEPNICEICIKEATTDTCPRCGATIDGDCCGGIPRCQACGAVTA